MKKKIDYRECLYQQNDKIDDIISDLRIAVDDLADTYEAWIEEALKDKDEE